MTDAPILSSSQVFWVLMVVLSLVAFYGLILLYALKNGMTGTQVTGGAAIQHVAIAGTLLAVILLTLQAKIGETTTATVLGAIVGYVIAALSNQRKEP